MKHARLAASVASLDARLRHAARFKSDLTAEQVDALVAHVRTFKK